jgi:hypothetical protein
MFTLALKSALTWYPHPGQRNSFPPFIFTRLPATSENLSPRMPQREQCALVPSASVSTASTPIAYTFAAARSRIILLKWFDSFRLSLRDRGSPLLERYFLSYSKSRMQYG